VHSKLDITFKVFEILIKLFCLLMIFLSFGHLLPFWSFINTLQLITHTPLIQTMMPTNAVIVLRRLLDISRLDFFMLTELAQAYWGLNDPGSGAHSLHFEVFGYKQIHLIPSLGFLVLAGALTFLVWLVALIKKLFVRHVYRPKSLFLRYKRHEEWMFNFGVRLFYESFLEVCICTFLHLAHWDEQTSGNGLAVVLLIAIICFVLLIETLFWTNGHLFKTKKNEQGYEALFNALVGLFVKGKAEPELGVEESGKKY